MVPDNKTMGNGPRLESGKLMLHARKRFLTEECKHRRFPIQTV